MYNWAARKCLSFQELQVNLFKFDDLCHNIHKRVIVSLVCSEFNSLCQEYNVDT